MEGRLGEAGEAAGRGAELSLSSSDPALKLPHAIQKARVEMASLGQNQAGSAAALQGLHSTIVIAQRLGYYRVECEARIALGEFELKTNPSLGHKHLTTLASEMRGRGLELLARQAEDALGNGLDVVAGNRSAH
jgi:hypothetical protein